LIKFTLPLFIVFEGIDGSGKSTISEMIYNFYRSLDVPVIRKAEPSGGIWGLRIREMLKGPKTPDVKEQLRLFLLDRDDDVKKNILPALQGGKMIIMDRYFYSNAAYQGAAGIKPEDVLEENIRMGFPEPDRIYLIDIDPEKALERISRRNDSGREEIFEKAVFLNEVRKIYLSIKNDKFVVIDGSKSPGDIFNIVKNDIEEWFCRI
jgi:dTMP kinase